MKARHFNLRAADRGRSATGPALLRGSREVLRTLFLTTQLTLLTFTPSPAEAWGPGDLGSRVTRAAPILRNAGQPVCVAHCDEDRQVTVDEVVRAVNIALGHVELAICRPADRDGSGEVTVDELIEGVRRLLYGCGQAPYSTFLVRTCRSPETPEGGELRRANRRSEDSRACTPHCEWTRAATHRHWPSALRERWFQSALELASRPKRRSTRRVHQRTLRWLPVLR